MGSYLLGVSPYGLYDMAGNVMEWVADWYQRDYYSGSPYANPPGPPTGQVKVIRGGSVGAEWTSLRVAIRSMLLNPVFSNNSLGFRCVVGSPGE